MVSKRSNLPTSDRQLVFANGKNVKRLAYLINQYPAISHTFVRREIQALEKLGYEVDRYSIRRPKDDVISEADQSESAKTTVVLDWIPCLTSLTSLMVRRPGRFFAAVTTTVRLWQNAGSGGLRYLAYLFEAAHLTDSLNRNKIEHLHVHFGTNSTTVALIASRLGGPSFSFTVHGPEEFDRPITESLQLKIESATFVVAISSFGRSQLQRWCALEQWAKIHVVHCGLDASFIQRACTPVPDVRRFVCVGRLSEQKGHFVLLQAAKQLALQTRDFKITLIGDGDFRPALEAYVRSSQLEAQIEFAGWQTENEVQRSLEVSRCMVLPSFAEGLPVVIMEALAMGRPVITTYVAGIPELVVNGRNGWLVPAGDVGQLAAAMSEALETPCDRLTEMGRHGKDAVCRQHNVDTEARVLMDAIRAAD